MINPFNESIFDMVIESVDSDTMERLRGEKTYQKLVKQQRKIIKQFPVVEQLFEKEGAISLNEKEHEALLEYYFLQQQKETAERKGYYWCGHKHAHSYLQTLEQI